MRSCGAAASEAPLSLRATELYSVSIKSVDLPPPETPVMQVNRPERDFGGDVLEIVAACVHDLELTAQVARFALRHRHGELAGHVFAGP